MVSAQLRGQRRGAVGGEALAGDGADVAVGALRARGGDIQNEVALGVPLQVALRGVVRVEDGRQQKSGTSGCGARAAVVIERRR